MRVPILLLAFATVGRALLSEKLYPFDPSSDSTVPKGDSESSQVLQLQWPIIFYGNNFTAVSVHSDGFITLEKYEEDSENTKEAVLAPFMLDLDSTTQGEIYYKEHTEKHTLHRASKDIHRAFRETADDFRARSVFVATWSRVQSSTDRETNFTFQCIVASDGLSSYAIFLYPSDEFAVSSDTETTRNLLSGRAGFNDRGWDVLETLSANELLDGGNARSPGEWIFQIGSMILNLVGIEQPVHHAKADAELLRRESGFEVPEVNFNEDYGTETGEQCGDHVCDENARCVSFRNGDCCQCEDGFFGDGVACISTENPVRYNGRISGYSIVMNEDNSWNNETANNVDLHSYVVTQEGRAFSVMNGDLSPELSRALQPMLIFSTTLGWIFANAEAPSINGFQYTGGQLVSDTYIRYLTGAYEFRIRQTYEGVADDESGGGKVLQGKMEFSGRLPSVAEGEEMRVNDFYQTYTKTAPGKIVSSEKRSYTIGDVDHEYSVDQSITFSGCGAALDEVPDKITVNVTAIYIQYISSEANLRFAMNNHMSASGEVTTPDGGESVGVRPELPRVEIPEPTEAVVDLSLTKCERERKEAQDLQPLVQDEVFAPKCTDLGYFERKQCMAYDSTCWCVDPDSGGEIAGTRTEPRQGYDLECTEKVDQSLTKCERQLQEARALQPQVQDEVFFPTCTDLGTYAPRQCLSYNAICWCVDSDSGEEISGTKTEPQRGYDLDCSDIRPPPPSLTPCEQDRFNAEVAQSQGGSAANSIFMPRCMESGAFEPLQQLPDGSFMCVDFSGQELSRSTERPECLSPCQMQSYIAKSTNIFKGTNHFVIQCNEDGSYRTEQCVETYCYCVDRNGIEIQGSRVETEIRISCDRFFRRPTPVVPDRQGEPELPATTPFYEPERPVIVPVERPSRPQPPLRAGRLMFAQSMGINIIDLPVSRGAISKRLFARSDQTAVALGYDCSSSVFYWTDVSKRLIYSSDINGSGSRKIFSNDKIRSPEGIAVDFLSGNVYWTDSEYKRIEVASTDGSNRMTLISGEMFNPRGIAVDPFRGRMYWTDWNRKAPKIWTADMDGSNKRVLISEGLGLPNDITIDFNYQKICFVDAGTKRVECMNIDGSGREVIYTLPNSPIQHPFGLAVDGDTLYYSTWRGSKAVHAVNWRTGEDIPIAGPRGAHGQMFGVEIIPPTCPRGYNHCVNNNGGCSHLCFPTPRGRECKCPPNAPGCYQ